MPSDLDIIPGIELNLNAGALSATNSHTTVSIPCLCLRLRFHLYWEHSVIHSFVHPSHTFPEHMLGPALGGLEGIVLGSRPERIHCSIGRQMRK